MSLLSIVGALSALALVRISSAVGQLQQREKVFEGQYQKYREGRLTAEGNQSWTLWRLPANRIRGLVGKNDWPRYTEEEPEMYDQEELDKLLKACTGEERLWFEFFLMTGMREQEVMHTYWSDLNFGASTVRVSHKPDRNWTPKAYKEREIPIPAKLVKKLKARKAKADKTCGLVFPTSGCNPKLDFLDCLKTCAERAELDKDDFWLHKFRSTFATRCL